MMKSVPANTGWSQSVGTNKPLSFLAITICWLLAIETLTVGLEASNLPAFHAWGKWPPVKPPLKYTGG